MLTNRSLFTKVGPQPPAIILLVAWWRSECVSLESLADLRLTLGSFTIDIELIFSSRSVSFLFLLSLLSGVDGLSVLTLWTFLTTISAMMRLTLACTDIEYVFFFWWQPLFMSRSTWHESFFALAWDWGRWSCWLLSAGCHRLCTQSLNSAGRFSFTENKIFHSATKTIWNLDR